GIILEEFFSAYNDLCRAKISRKPFKNKFKEYLKWLHGQDKEEQESFWKKYLAGLEHSESNEKLERKVPRKINNTSTRRIIFPVDQAAELEALCKKYRISLPSFFYCAWGLLLLQYQQCRDLFFDTTVSGRSAEVKGIEAMVGLFINTLPVRVNIQPGENILDMLQRINMMILRWQEFESSSLLFIKKLLMGYDNPGTLFDSVLVIENYPLDVKSLLESSELPFSVDSVINTGMTAYDLAVLITLFDDNEITAEFTYDNSIFDQDMITLVTDHFVSLIAEIAGDPWKPVTDIQLPDREREVLRNHFNKKSMDVTETVYIAPVDDVEKKLAAVWAEVLKVDKERISVQADFFAFGGHSLS
ncbi:MAG: condensation domain-containing protein, partial [Candidatus Aminicenantes bacterium]|nr:condensation domain-containing protein [Candidatus Aminicenantes bacterium]